MEKAIVLIVEDQVLIAKSIESMVADHGLEVMGICKSGEEAIALVQQKLPDVVIMDIRLHGKLDGIQTAKELQLNERIPVIYLSDYTDKGTVRRAKETLPANYLSKPFTEQDLLRAIDIAVHNANASKATHEGGEEFIFVKSQDVYSKLRYDRINYIEADRAYCNVHATDKVYRLSISMSALGDQLDKSRFIKVHRSYMVNIQKITEFDGADVTVSGQKLPVSDQHRAELMNRLKVIH